MPIDGPSRSNEISIETRKTNLPLDQMMYDCYTEYAIRNTTGEHIYLLGVDGEVRILPTDRVDSSTMGFRGVVLAKREKYPSKDEVGRVKLVTDNSNRDLTHKYIPVVCLRHFSNGRYINTPRYVPELNIVVSLVNDAEAMKAAHPYLRDRQNSTDLVLSANSHDLTIRHVYLAVNNCIAKIDVTHDEHRPEEVTFFFPGATPERPWGGFHCSITDQHIPDVAYNEAWGALFGTDFDKVYEKSLELRSIGSTEDEIISNSVKEIDLKRKVANAQKELELTKEDKALVDRELSRYTTKEQEQFVDASLNKKLELESLKGQQTISKADADKELAMLKLQQEQIAARANEAQAGASMLKSAAVVVPVVATAAMYCAKQSATAALLPLAASGAWAGPVGLAVSAATALAVAMVMSDFGSGFREKLKDGTQAIWSFIKNTTGRVVETAKNIASRIVDGTIDLAHTSIDWCQDTVISAFSGAASKIGGIAKTAIVETAGAFKKMLALAQDTCVGAWQKACEIGGGIVDGIKSFTGSILDTGKDIVSSVWEKTCDIGESILDGCSSFVDTITSWRPW